MAASNKRGQSILEFLFMLPVLAGLSLIMLRMNTAIQVSIVNQQYARSQALFLAMNSPQFPRLGLRQSALTDAGFNQYFIGVSENVAPTQGDYVPKATVVRVSNRKNAGSNQNQDTPPERSLVRVRNTVTICTQSNVLSNGTAILPLAGNNAVDSNMKATSTYTIPENAQFAYCRTPVEYAP